MLAQAIESEVEVFLADYAHLTLGNGHRRVVRNGYLPEREIQTGIGPVSVRMPEPGTRAGPAQAVGFVSLPKFCRPI